MLPTNHQRNTRNQDNPLFTALTRIFSGPIVKRRRQFYTRERRKDLDKYTFDSASGLPFKSTRDLFSNMTARFISEQQRSERYSDFDAMVYEPIIASALNLVADEMTTSDIFEEVLKIKCHNQEIKSILHDFFYNVININHNLYHWARMMCKFGDYFLYLDIDEKIGIINVIPLPNREIERMEGQDPTNPNYIQFQWNSGGLTFENWQICHFRMLGDDKFACYGQSFLEPARRIWRQLCLTGENRVWVKDTGWKHIRDIAENDHILSFDLDSRKLVETTVKKKAWMGLQPVIQLETPTRSIRVTPEHGMLVCDSGGNYLYKKAKDIVLFDENTKTGDCLILPNKWQEEHRTKIVEFPEALFNTLSQPEQKFFKDRKFFTNAKFVKLFGILLKWGYLGRFDSVGFICNNEELRKRRDEIKATFREIFPFLHEKMDYESFPRGRGGKYVHFFKSLHFIFKSLGMESDVEKRSVPQWIYSLEQTQKLEFIRGLVGIRENPKQDLQQFVYWKESFLGELQVLCQQSGVRVGKNITSTRKQGHYNLPGFLNDEKVYRLSIDEHDVKYEEISKEYVIKKELQDKKEYTYDIQVDHPIHNFTVEGLISHNTLIEDAMMSYRIVRSPERRVFYLDVGNIPPEDVQQHVLKFISENKKEQIVDPLTGRVDLRFAPMSVSDDYYIPVRGQSGTKIETLPGGSYVGDIDDVKYLQAKLFAALQIPASYLLTTAESGAEGSTTLSQKDVRFSRTIQRLQKYVIAELEKMAQIHLYTLGFRGDDLINFSFSLNNPSKIAALQELETWRTKFDVASAASEGHFSKRWIHTNIFGLSEEEFVRNQREIYNDKKYEAHLSTVVQGVEQAELGSGGLGGGGGGLGGGGLGGGMEEVTLDDANMGLGGEAGTEGTEADDDNPIMALPPDKAPAKRNDGKNQRRVMVNKKALLGKPSHTTPGSRGKAYTPVDDDKRRNSGPRKRQMDAMWGKSTSRNTPRNTFGQKIPNLGAGITEGEEQHLLDNEKELIIISESMEQKNEVET